MKATVRRHLGSTGPFLLLLALAMGVSWKRGQDANWDLLNYHLYNAWAFLNGIPYHFAAGIQGYFDPFLDLPYYWLATGPLAQHPQLLQLLAGLPYGILLGEIYLLARIVVSELPLGGTVGPRALTWMMVLLAGSGAATWVQVGTTTNEITVAAIDMLGVLVLARGIGLAEGTRGRMLRAAAVGACLGLAAGLKLTAAVYLPALGLYYLVTGRGLAGRLGQAAVYSTVAIAVFLASYGPWGLHLLRATGNPFFPMFNDLFHSGMASAASSGRDLRFMPHGVLQWVFYPFYWLRNNHTVYELDFRDARYAAFYVLMLLLPVLMLFSRRFAQEVSRCRAMTGLALIAVAGYVVWLLLFSILRYTIVIDVIASVLVPAALYLVLHAVTPLRRLPGRAVGIAVFAAFLVGASGHAAKLGFVRYQDAVYSVSPISLPQGAMLVFADQPMAIFAPMIGRNHPGVVYAGLPGDYGPGGAFYNFGIGRDLRRLLTEHAGLLYVAYYLHAAPSSAGLDAFGVSIDFEQCQFMTSNIAAPVAICRASYAGHVIRPIARFRLEPQATAVKQMHLDVSPGECMNRASPGRLSFHWYSSSGADEIRVFTGPLGAADKLFAEGGATGSASTGQWVASGQEFVFKDGTGHVLARVLTRYVPCGKETRG